MITGDYLYFVDENKYCVYHVEILLQKLLIRHGPHKQSENWEVESGVGRLGEKVTLSLSTGSAAAG